MCQAGTNHTHMMKNLIHILFLSACLIHHAPADEKPTVIKDDTGVSVEYRGVLTEGEKRLRNLAEHRVIARYKGAPYEVCMGETGACPERCGASGEYATFEVNNYLSYVKHHDRWGDDKQKEFRVQISDFNKVETGDKQINSVIKSLKEGDLVLLEQRHLYGKIAPGSEGPVRPILLLKKISAEEAKVLLEKEGQVGE